MFDKNSLLNLLPDLKGSPLSIVLFLALQGDRTVSMNELTEGTGFSDKPIKAGLKLLMDRQIVCRPRVNRYQLTGKNLQLPLYWNETIEALPGSGETPKISGDFPELMRRIEEHELRIRALESGDFPKFGELPGKSGDSPKIEILPAGNNFGDSPKKIGEIPENSGETPKKDPDPIKELINIYENKEVSKYVDTDTYLLNKGTADKQLPESGDSPKNPGDIPELFVSAWNAAMRQMEANMGKGSFMDILRGAVPAGFEDGHYTILMDNTFKRDWAEARLTDTVEKILMMMLDQKVTVSWVVDSVREQGTGNREPENEYEAPTLELLPGSGELIGICNDYLLDPIGIDFSREQLRELIDMEPDPEVLRFVLPIVTKFENAKTWCGKDLQAAKRSLLRKYGIVNGMAAEIVHNEAATLEMIYEVCRELCPENKDAVGSRIRALTSEGKIPEF